MQNLEEATKQACEEPTLVDALTFICVWESERIVKQAHKNLTENIVANPDTGARWDTCFEACIKSVMENFTKPTDPRIINVTDV